MLLFETFATGGALFLGDSSALIYMMASDELNRAKGEKQKVALNELMVCLFTNLN